ncbi:MAG: phenylacetate-CoA oxygenase subunit PaaJ [Bacteroidia bacterium]|nr:phenylacetate-CoA oxygenase subunit PaaJ [Bacteroidia bacterium]MBT8269773.1 phenylacetate-CoA oxygenase subunit PaaJ [Bacteroidia bacterium]NNF83358.1 phenylacetate-CoA oxygenase subunit PaaJ [Flavobacteriaceae bacterium]NNK69347.1 phenylacetate-CoA oxygenase subunit PaaJ [Flavobacteriaceae bacterium]NNL81084.1 phenylacetate-CoA oxygenase subunit PaaJ [Flavobacteriaceae bacterium]
MEALTLHIDKRLISILEKVPDPEIPVLSVIQMGVVRNATVTGNKVLVKITPTYSGCPAMDVIAEDIIKALGEEGYKAKVDLILAPAWTTDWITQKGRDALAKYGIAPPLNATADKAALSGDKKLVKCTLCGSKNTRVVSPFGSTPCKALFQCEDCKEPFDYFKCLK